MRILDLTLPLDTSTRVYVDRDGYRDPAFRAEPWATVAQHGYSVHCLQLGTHTGTHLDAPTHFHPGRRTVDQVPPSALVGQALVIDARPWPRITSSVLQPYAGRLHDADLPLFLTPGAGVPLAAEAVAAVVRWRPRLILYAGQFIDEGERYHHTRVWLGADIPLVTDLNPETAGQVRDGDLLVVAPLPLVGLDGSPCRVFALQAEGTA